MSQWIPPTFVGNPDFYYAEPPHGGPFTAPSLSGTEVFESNVERRDGPSCVVCDFAVPSCLDYYYIIGSGQTMVWDLLIVFNWIPPNVKSVAHECRNGVIMCKTHGAAFENFEFFVRYIPSRHEYVFVNHALHPEFEQFHDFPLRLDPNDVQAPFPCLFLMHEYYVRSKFTFNGDRYITEPDFTPIATPPDTGHSRSITSEFQNGESEFDEQDDDVSWERPSIASSTAYDDDDSESESDSDKDSNDGNDSDEDSDGGSDGSSDDDSEPLHYRQEIYESSFTDNSDNDGSWESYESEDLLQDLLSSADQDGVNGNDSDITSPKSDSGTSRYGEKQVLLGPIQRPEDLFTRRNLDAWGFRNWDCYDNDGVYMYEEYEEYGLTVENPQWAGTTAENILKWMEDRGLTHNR